MPEEGGPGLPHTLSLRTVSATVAKKRKKLKLTVSLSFRDTRIKMTLEWLMVHRMVLTLT